MVGNGWSSNGKLANGYIIAGAKSGMGGIGTASTITETGTGSTVIGVADFLKRKLIGT